MEGAGERLPEDGSNWDLCCSRAPPPKTRGGAGGPVTARTPSGRPGAAGSTSLPPLARRFRRASQPSQRCAAVNRGQPRRRGAATMELDDPPPRRGMLRRTTASFKASMRHGATLVCLVADNAASRQAVRMAQALLQPRDELQLLTVVTDEDSRPYGDALLAPLLVELAGDGGVPPEATVTPLVLVKGEERLADVIKQHVAAAAAELLVLGSHNLCAAGSRSDPLPASGSFALRLIKSLRSCPVLVVKANSRGPFLHGASAGLKVMVDCKSNSRHLLSWLMDRVDAERDSLFLAVTKAHEPSTGVVKEATKRMLSTFTVQAGVEDFYTVTRVFREGTAKALPQAVDADGIDVLAVQAPNCALLPASVLELLAACRSSVLVWQPKGGSMGQLSLWPVGEAVAGGGAVPAGPFAVG